MNMQKMLVVAALLALGAPVAAAVEVDPVVSPIADVIGVGESQPHPCGNASPQAEGNGNGHSNGCPT